MKRLSQLTLISLGFVATTATLAFTPPVQAATFGFADVVLDYFDSGVGPLVGPYGGEFPGGAGFPIPVSTDVVLGDDPNTTVDFLSLPLGSFVTVGFTDEIIVDGPGDDLFIREVGAAGEMADVFVSSQLTNNMANFTFLGTAIDNVSTGFDLSSIGFTGGVKSVKIVGLDTLGDSPGFDVVNVQGLPGSTTPIPTPALLPGLISLFGMITRKKKITDVVNSVVEV